MAIEVRGSFTYSPQTVGSDEVVGVFQLYDNDVLITTPLSDANLTVFTVKMTDQANTNIFTVNKGDAELTAGGSNAPDAVFLQVSVAAIAAGQIIAGRLSGTYNGTTFDHLIGLAAV